jgi:hypothetical protein
MSALRFFLLRSCTVAGTALLWPSLTQSARTTDPPAQTHTHTPTHPHTHTGKTNKYTAHTRLHTRPRPHIDTPPQRDTRRLHIDTQTRAHSVTRHRPNWWSSGVSSERGDSSGVRLSPAPLRSPPPPLLLLCWSVYRPSIGSPRRAAPGGSEPARSASSCILKGDHPGRLPTLAWGGGTSRGGDASVSSTLATPLRRPRRYR